MKVLEDQQVSVDKEMKEHAEQTVYQLKSLVGADVFLDEGTSSEKGYLDEKNNNFKFIDDVITLIKHVFKDENDSFHKVLVEKLSQKHVFVQEYCQDEYSKQQLMEVFYDLELLLARKSPLNTLSKTASEVIYTSSQHCFEIRSLVADINKNSGDFLNTYTGYVFNKRDVQLIKLAAQKCSLRINSKDVQTEKGREKMQELGLQDVNVVVKSRYKAEENRVFNSERIYQAVVRAFLHVYKNDVFNSKKNQDGIDRVTIRVVQKIIQENKGSDFVEVELVQEYVESVLMELGFYDVARSYVLYRDEKKRVRQFRLKQLEQQNLTLSVKDKGFEVLMKNGNRKRVFKAQIISFLKKVFHEYDHLNINNVVDQCYRSLFEGIDYIGLNEALTMSCRSMIEIQPDYSYVTARILRKRLLDEAYLYLENKELLIDEIPQDYSNLLAVFIKKGIVNELLDPALERYDLDKLSKAIDCKRDSLFSYLGLQTLYDRYFIHDDNIRYELPQIFFMRVAMGLAIREKDRNDKAIIYYNLLSKFDYMTSTPTLFNSACVRPQLSSCFLTTVPDDLHGIYGAIQDNAMLSKFAGGLGNDWTNVRGTGAKIKGTNGVSSGIIPFLNVADATAVAVNQGGKRKGAVCAYLETWHIDILDFVELRKNTGDDRRRTHDMNTANWIPDLFMERVMEKGTWTLFSPEDTPDLHDCYGMEFRKKYESYESKAKNGKILYRTIDAVVLWRKMLSMLFETGHPWMTFKDPCNIRSPQRHCGVVHSSNLCTEITLNTSSDEIAVCNLGSINLAQHVTPEGLDKEKLKQTIDVAIRMLDNVIDINYYAVEQARNSNMRHRPIGLGLMGFQDALYTLGIPYESEQAIDFADKSMELISYYAISASMNLAKERGVYASYDGSLWSKGILPIDSISMLRKERGEKYLTQDSESTLDWDSLRKDVKKYGIRNSNVMAIAPTATIANICGVTQSIEPTYKNLFVKSNLSGEFTVVNPSLVKDLQESQLWDDRMVDALKISNGSVQNIDRIPDSFKQRYKTSFEVDISFIVRAAAKRSKWIDQSQSLNLYMSEASGKKLDKLYKMAWLSGLKTCYYLRSLGASDSEKSSISDGALNLVKQCSIEDPDCEACQ